MDDTDHLDEQARSVLRVDELAGEMQPIHRQSRTRATCATAILSMLACALSDAAAGQSPAGGGASDSQTYELNYVHTLRNRTPRVLDGVVVYLPVPPSDEYQKVRRFSVESHGATIHISNRTDAYGNKIQRLALPPIEPSASISVGCSFVVELGAPPKIALDPASRASLEDIPEEIRDRFTIDARILGLATPEISQSAEKISKAHPNPVARAIAIHDFIAGTFAYKSEDGWDPAPEVIARKSGSCTEFCYVFAALCRVTGIPTRFVGGSIFPLKSPAPFHDGGHHRWVEAFLPGHGWVPFDPTLDRSRPANRNFVGTHHPRVLVLTRIGTRSLQLGLSYVGSNSKTGETVRKRVFTWSQGTETLLEAALKRLDAGQSEEGRAALADLVAKWPGTRAAFAAQERLGKFDAASK